MGDGGYRKACKRCGVVKESEGFRANARSSDGLQYACRECEAAYTARWRKTEAVKYEELKARSAARRRKQYAEDEEHRANVRARNKTYWHSLSPEEKKRRGWANHLRTAYDMSVREYEALLLAQDGRCACCRRKAKSSRSLVVDHDHGEEGGVRGLLCYGCNSGISLLGDSEEGLQQGIDYLRRYREGEE